MDGTKSVAVKEIEGKEESVVEEEELALISLILFSLYRLALLALILYKSKRQLEFLMLLMRYA